MKTLLAFLLLLGAGYAQTTAGPIPSSLFGITSVSSSNYPTVPFGALGKGAQVSMSYIEQVKGTRVWTTLDAYVAAANSHGVPFHWAMDEAPPWAASTCHVAIVGIQKCSGDVTDVAGLDAFYTALTTRYNGSSGHGHIDVFELYNEPETAFTGSIANLVTQTNHLAVAVRVNAPSAKVAGLQTTYPDTYYTSGNLLDTYWAAGGTKSLDAVGFHGYPHHGTDVPEILNTFVPVIKSALTRNGMSASVPIYQTEGSWGDITETGWMVTDPDQQAAWVARTYLLAWSNGVSRYIWYSWDAYPWGALTISGTLQQAGTAYQQIYSWMVASKMTAPCRLSGLWSCPLTLANGHQALAVWNNVLSNATVSYTPASQYTVYHTLAGATVSVTGSVSIGQQPILFEATAATIPAGENQYYVSTSGNDSNNGTSSGTAWLTLAHANSAYTLGGAGAIVNVAPGTYAQGAAQLNLTRSGSSNSAPVTYQCTTIRACTISNTLTGNNAVVQINGSFLHLIGFNILSASGSVPNLTTGVYITAHDVWVKQSTISNIQADCSQAGGGGIAVADNAGNNSVFDSNIVHDIGWAVSSCANANTVHGINLEPRAPSASTVTNNIIYRVKGGWGIQQFGASVGSVGTIIANNLIFSCGNGGIVIGESGGTVNHNTVINNMVFDNGTSQSKFGIYEFSVSGSNNRYANNDVFGNAGGDYHFQTGSQVGGISVDPALNSTFTNWAINGSGDYHLKTGSAAIAHGTTVCAAGVSSCSPVADFDGKVRPNPPSIGAFEANGSPVLPPAAPTGLTAIVQ